MISIDSKKIPLSKALQWTNDPMTRAMLGASWRKLLTDIVVDYKLAGRVTNRLPPWEMLSCAINPKHEHAVVEGRGFGNVAKPLCLDCAIRHSLAFGPGDVVPLVRK